MTRKKKSYPVLYPSSYNRKGLGLGVLRDATLCEVTECRNGSFELKLEYKKDGFLFKSIEVGNVIKANASKYLKEQLFRIYNTEKDINGNIIAYAEHITQDLQKNFIEKVSLTNSNAHVAMNTLIQNMADKNGFTAYSNLTGNASFEVERANPLDSIMGTDNSILSTYGDSNTDIKRDNFNISVLRNRGNDRNVLVAYKKNISGFKCIANNDELVTVIYPYMYKSVDLKTEHVNLEAISGDERAKLDKELITIENKFIYADNYKNYDIQYIKPVDFNDYPEWENYEKNSKNLEIFAKDYFNKNKCNYPKISYDIDIIALSETEEYKHLSFLEDIDICDVVTVKNDLYGITEKVKVTELKYDALNNKILSLKLGGEVTNLKNAVSDKLDIFNNQLQADKSELEMVIEHITNKITGSTGGHVKMYPPDNPAEIFIMNTDNPNTATEVLRLNKDGIGFAKNINGPYEIGWTSDGVFNANFIKSGTLSANLIKGGKLDASVIEGLEITADMIAGLEINADWITSGTLSADLIKGGKLTNKDGTIEINLDELFGDGASFIVRHFFNDKLQDAVSIKGPRIRLHDWVDPATVVGEMLSGQVEMTTKSNENIEDKEETKKQSAIWTNHIQGSIFGLGYSTKWGTMHPYMWFDSTQEKNHINIPGEIGLKAGNINVNGILLNDIPTFGIDVQGATTLRANNGAVYLRDEANNALFGALTGKNVSYQKLDMNFNQILNAKIIGLYTDELTRSTISAYGAMSLQEELSYTFEAKTKEKELYIPLNEKIKAITKDDYIVQLTPYSNCNLWAEKYDNYFIVKSTEDDTEFSCRVIKKMNDNSLNAKKINNNSKINLDCKSEKIILQGD